MKRYITLFFLLVIGLVFQSTLFEKAYIFDVKPNLLLVVVVIYALFYGGNSAAKLGIIYGLVEDIVTGKFIGLKALSMMAAGYAAGLGSSGIYRDNPLAPIATFFFGITMNYVVLFVIGLIVGFPGVYPFKNFFVVSFVSIVYNLSITFLIYIIYRLELWPFNRLIGRS